MTYDFIFMNPPYGSIGGPIATEAKKYARKTVCLMPLSCYKAEKNELYRYVGKMELADPKMFEDASITNNLCICTLRKDVVDKYKTYEELSMESYDPKFKAFYEYNKAHKVLDWHSAYKEDYQTLNIDTDFVELDRLADAKGGSGYGTGGCGYKWNVLKDGYQDCWAASIVCIHFETPKQKNNFASWWYQGAKGKSFSSKVNLGLNSRTPSFLAIPQIDWETISDTQLWKEGKYDEAVLSEMGLKWDDEKDGVVRK